MSDYNQLIKKHFAHLSQPPHNGSVKHFLETGTISGGLYTALHDLMKSVSKEATTVVIESNSKDSDFESTIKHFQDDSDQSSDMQNIPHFRD